MASEEVDADAFKRLYPDQYYTKFLKEGVRPDGRPLGRARAVTIGAGAITSADGSALVKIGRSSALAGVRLEIIRPDETAPGSGQLQLNVELAPFSSADYRSNRQQPEYVSAVAERLSSVLLGPSPTSSSGATPWGNTSTGSSQEGAVQLSSLCIEEGKAAWRARLDVYILDADGCLLDVTLLAAVAALRNTRLPPVRSTKEGRYFIVRRGVKATVSSQQEGEAEGMGTEGTGAEGEEGGLVAGSPTAVAMSCLPLSLTCCLYQQYVLVDPTADEERLAECSVSVVADQAGRLQGRWRGPWQK